jgi:hypothetical protein
VSADPAPEKSTAAVIPKTTLIIWLSVRRVTDDQCKTHLGAYKRLLANDSAKDAGSGAIDSSKIRVFFFELELT